MSLASITFWVALKFTAVSPRRQAASDISAYFPIRLRKKALATGSTPLDVDHVFAEPIWASTCVP